MKIVTAEEMRAIDRATTEKYGVPSLTLMENAGAAVAEFAQKHFKFDSVCMVCGKGNNGGDGFVAGRKLHEAGKKVSVIVLIGGLEDLRGDAAEMFKKLPVPVFCIPAEKYLDVPKIQEAFESDLIIDAVLGTGFKPPLKSFIQNVIARINQAPGFVLAVDVPSGIDADLAEPPEPDAIYVRADGIISFTALKPALVFSNLTDGPVAIASIGSPESVISAHSRMSEHVLTIRDVYAISPPRSADSHKGDFGHVLVIGGSVGKSGAAAMAGIAALRAGAGLVTVASPKSVQPLIAAYAPELMTVPLPETEEGTISLLALAEREKLLHGKSVVVIGPGISRNEETAEFVRDLVSVCSASMVIDADGLNAFEGVSQELLPDSEVGRFSVRVLTPHPGEMSTLTGIPTGQVQSNRIGLARKTAAETQTWLVLKGHRTVITDPYGHTWINTTGNPGMAKGGSGDVLSGITAGILAQFKQMEYNDDQMLSELEGDPDIELSPTSIFRWISVNDSEAAKIKSLRAEYWKTRDIHLLSELRGIMDEKLKQTIALLASLYVAKAVYIHGLAGDIAAATFGQQSMIATDIIKSLGEAFAVCQHEAMSKFSYIQR
ncbi:MAG TPA: NAD(P)H-hydrate dehydratase [Candidatus Angelobacter sp.]|nr:NAD(P)H-hydrate dehydratase [Candidatus Angelobacter sp.]